MADNLEHEARDAGSDVRRVAYRELAAQWRRLAASYEDATGPDDEVTGRRSCPELRSARRRLN